MWKAKTYCTEVKFNSEPDLDSGSDSSTFIDSSLNIFGIKRIKDCENQEINIKKKKRKKKGGGEGGVNIHLRHGSLGTHIQFFANIWKYLSFNIQPVPRIRLLKSVNKHLYCTETHTLGKILLCYR